MKFLDHVSVLAELTSLSLPPTFTDFLRKKKMKSTFCIFHKSCELHHSYSLQKKLFSEQNAKQSYVPVDLVGILLLNNELLFSLPGSWGQMVCSITATMSTVRVSWSSCLFFFFSLLPLIFTLLTLLCKIITISYSNTNDKLINCNISILVQYKLYGHYDQYTGTIASPYSCFQEMNWKIILSTIFVCFKVSVYKKWNLATPTEHKIIFFPKSFFLFSHYFRSVNVSLMKSKEKLPMISPGLKNSQKHSSQHKSQQNTLLKALGLQSDQIIP